jgi:hypothetical protein
MRSDFAQSILIEGLNQRGFYSPLLAAIKMTTTPGSHTLPLETGLVDLFSLGSRQPALKGGG